MKDEIKVTGMVIDTMPVGEFNRRLKILTRELGKISVFANNAAKQGSPLMGAAVNFAFGEFYIAKGRSAYNLHAASIKNRFEQLSCDIEGTCCGCYFLELADYFAHEGMEAEELLKLLYLSLTALTNKSLEDRLVRRIFELRAMMIDGEYTEQPPEKTSRGCERAWRFVLTAPLEKLYTFRLSKEALEDFEGSVEKLMKRFVGKKFKSLDILEELLPSLPESDVLPACPEGPVEEVSSAKDAGGDTVSDS